MDAFNFAEALIKKCKKTKDPYLDLGNCGIQELPEELFECTWVTTLILSSEWSEDGHMQAEGEFKGSTSRNTREPNHLEIFPEAFGNLVNLETLIAAYQPIADITPLSKLEKLRKLNLDGARIETLEPLRNLTELRSLSLSFAGGINRLEPIKDLDELEQLFLNGLSINDLGPLINLDKLKELGLRETQIHDLGPIIYLDSLTVLDVAMTQIHDLKPLSGLKDLVWLNLSHTQFEDLEPIGNLENLKDLFIESTRISDLSPLKNLHDLEVLVFRYSGVTQLEPLKDLDALQKFDASSCPIEDCPADVFETGEAELLRAFFSQKEIETENIVPTKKQPNKKTPRKTTIKKDSLRDVKLILIGNSNSGKTSMLHYLKENNFLTERNSTHGLDVLRWYPDPERFPLLKDVAVSIWDFGGQEYYHGAFRLFMSANAAYLLMWDDETNCNHQIPTKLQTEGPELPLQHFELRYWLDTVQHYGGKDGHATLLVVQNKCDLHGKKRIDQQIHDEYSIDESFNISLKSGVNGSDLREKRNLLRLDSELEYTLSNLVDKTSLPDDWLLIRTSILELQLEKIPAKNPFKRYLAKDGTSSISLTNFEKACAKLLARELNESEKGATLPTLFERGGVVTFFPHSKGLSDKIFLRPAELADKIYDVLKHNVLDLGGEFKLDEIFEKEDSDFQKIFVEATKSLQLVYEHPNKEGVYLAPQYFPESHPIEDLFDLATNGAWQSAFWVRVPLFYYKKVLYGLVVHYAVEENLASYYWKHGIVFVKDGLRVLLKGVYPEANQSDGRLMVSVEKGPGSEQLQKEIFHRMRWLLTHQKTRQTMATASRSKKSKSAASAENEFEAFAKNILSQPIPKWLEVSKDGDYYVHFNDLSEAVGGDEIRVHSHGKGGGKKKMLIREFEALLDKQPKQAKRVFVSYSHQNTEWLNRLKPHLSGLQRSNEIETWTDHAIIPGDEWDQAIKDSMLNADVFILMLSASFIASNYIWDIELKGAFEKYTKEKKMVIPILIEPLDLGSLPGVVETTAGKSLKIQDFEISPKTSAGYLKAVSLWANQEEALSKVAEGIRKAILKVKK